MLFLSYPPASPGSPVPCVNEARLLENCTISVRLEKCHANFHRNCLTFSKPFYAALLAGKCDPNPKDPCIDASSEFLDFHSVANGIFLSSAQKQDKMGFGYNNAPPLQITIQEGFTFILNVSRTQIFQSPFSLYRLENNAQLSPPTPPPLIPPTQDIMDIHWTFTVYHVKYTSSSWITIAWIFCLGWIFWKVCLRPEDGTGLPTRISGSDAPKE